MGRKDNMSEAKAKALTQDSDIKVELFCDGALIGNNAKTIDITNLLEWTLPEFAKGATMGGKPALPYFGGIKGYRTTNLSNGEEIASEITVLFTESDLNNIQRQILNLLQASIVNAKQLEALNSLVQNVFIQARYDKGNNLHTSTF